MINKGLMTSNSDEWATPQKLFDELDGKYHFTLDPCSTNENHKCDTYYTKQDDGLHKTWGGTEYIWTHLIGREIYKWVEKAYEENKKGTFVVCLLPARTDTRWFHEFIYKKHEIIFIKGRLKFNDGKNPAPFPSMLVIMK